MALLKVIIFGPTGQVGSAAARTAHELGAKVVLAMRDTQKPIPGLDVETEEQGSFERVQADLNDPVSVHDAVSNTQAKRAFIYTAYRSPDNMKATIQALKSAGIDLVVYLSSFTIRDDPQNIQASDVIPYIHAQVEINLREIYGPDGFVALRPGSFASNTKQYKEGLNSGEVKIYTPNSLVDCIAPEDIGRVGGTVLAKGPQDENRALYLYGPQLMSQEESVKTLAKGLGLNPKIGSMDESTAYEIFTEKRGLPAPIAKYMIKQTGLVIPGRNLLFGYPIEQDELSNVEKYTGKKATTFEEWVEQNKGLFIS
jgi:NAD(P)-dependent dehydrogenase (short-subunit alcohol dehydrogenase family)